MRKIKRLINCVFTDTVCTLNCKYCYVGQMEQHVRISTNLNHSLTEIRQALSYDRLGGCCHMNMCATGETLLVENILELAEIFIEEGHIVTIVTNGLISSKIEQICSWEKEIQDYLFLKISFHFLELKRTDKLKVFWENVKKIKAAGISFTIELTVNDESIPYVEEIKKQCMENIGELCHVIESRYQDDCNWPRLTKMPLEEHQRVWKSFESDLFEFQQSIWGEKRTEFCYAGDWISSINIKTGDVIPCFGGGKVLDNIYNDVEEPIRFAAIGKNCPWGHCYAAYVLLSHGAIPNFTNITYAEERNRHIENDRDWLGEKILYAFSHKLQDVNQEYSQIRKIMTDFVMQNVYEKKGFVLTEELRNELVSFFERNNIKKVSIYGAGNLGIRLYELLTECEINIINFIDKKACELHTPIACILPEQFLMETDIIIVSAYSQFTLIKKVLRNRGIKSPIVSILNLEDL